MSRILHHVGRNDFKKTRQRQIGEQKERAAQKLKELQEVEKERRQIQEEAKPFKSDWRRENLREFGEWAPIEGSGPTNGTSTTFGYFAGGSPVINGETGQQVTFTYSGLNGVENYPTTVTIDQGGGDVFQTAPPPFSQVGVQGYTAKLNPRYAEAEKKYQEEMKEWERKKEQQQKDIEATLKSFGTSYRNVQRDAGITKVGNSYVAIIPTNTRDFGSNLLNNVRVVRLVPCDPSQPMELTRNIKDISGTKAWNVTNAQYSDDVYLQIGEQPKAPIEQEYLMPRRTDFKDVNPQLDASQEFAQKVGADEFMNARLPRLNALGDKDTDMTDAELLNIVKEMLNFGLDAAAIFGILFPEPGTTAGGLARLATRGQRYTNIIGKALKWYNKGRRPGEHKMTRTDRIRDEWNQRGKFGQGENLGGWDVFRGFRPGVPADKGGIGSGPTPSFRRAIEGQSSGSVSPFLRQHLRRKQREEEEKHR